MRFLRAGLAVLVVAFLVVAVLAIPPAGEAQGQEAACVQRTFEGDAFTVCRYDAKRDDLQLTLRAASGKPYRRLSLLARELGDKAGGVRFAMNAGMFDGKGAPIGLYVENGKQLKAINTRDGFGNFHLKPNGVFWVGADGVAHVSASDDYVAQKPKAAWASQSGPMLVIDGKLHPKFDHDGTSRHVRNGVGIADASGAYFVISEAPVSFGKLARFFRDELKCSDALYFDGAVSSLWAPSLDRMDAGRDLGPLLVVTSR